MAEGISSFSIQIDEDGKSSTENNGGNGFPINDIIFPIIVPPRMGPPASCDRGDNTGDINNNTLNVLTAVSTYCRSPVCCHCKLTLNPVGPR